MLSSPVYPSPELRPLFFSSSETFLAEVKGSNRIPACPVVLLTLSQSPYPTPLLFCQQTAPINPLLATLMDLPASVANKRLTESLTLLDATLTKNTGVGLLQRQTLAEGLSSTEHGSSIGGLILQTRPSTSVPC